MNKTLLFVLVFTTCQLAVAQKYPSKIDSLSSNADIETLIRSFDKNYQKFSLKPITGFEIKYGKYTHCKTLADSLGITMPYYKSDFDNNGYTDLLAIGDYYGFNIFVVMNYGHDSLKLNRLSRRIFQDCTYPKIVNDTMIRYYYIPEPDWRKQEQASGLQYIDLIYKYGDFIEHNSLPKTYSIEKIEYQTSMCFGTCPQFYISVSKDKSSIFKAQVHNRESKNSKEIKGEFNTTLKDADFLEIINLLNYIDFPKLKDNYEVGWTDDQSCTLTITYNNGKVKKISDYGLIGTYGLDRLYQLLFDLRFNQKWNSNTPNR